jgi:hypothetical protein
MKSRRIAAVLWPSFLVAGMAEMFLFSAFDPHDLDYFGVPLELGRSAVYSLGFLLLWAFTALSSALTAWLAGHD